MVTRFRNRTEAGRQLVEKLAHYARRHDVVVLGLPRGGVPVAYEIAKALNAPLDICLVRKLGVPQHEELAMGAIAPGVRILNQDVINWLKISQPTIDDVAEAEQRELERRDRAYRTHYDPQSGAIHDPPIDVREKTVIIVDDGIATGSTLHAAISVLREQAPAALVVAVPVAPPSTYDTLTNSVDEVVCLMTPDRLGSIGAWYDDFSQLDDDEVCRLLMRAKRLYTAISA
ncbi:MAG TPA: phosphoribosyltransferase [Elainellaceae cyanobacterium]